MFYTERLMLRTIEPEADLNLWTQWLNDVEFLGAISAIPPMPSSKASAKKRLESIAYAPDEFPFFVVCEKPGLESEPRTLAAHDDYFVSDDKARYRPVGVLNVQGGSAFNPSTRIVGLGISMDREHQNRGYGTEVLNWALEYCFKTLGMHRVELKVDADNARAIHVYEKLGFKREGLRRKTRWLRGGWQDTVEMAMLEEEWFARQ